MILPPIESSHPVPPAGKAQHPLRLPPKPEHPFRKYARQMDSGDSIRVPMFDKASWLYHMRALMYECRWERAGVTEERQMVRIWRV